MAPCVGTLAPPAPHGDNRPGREEITYENADCSGSVLGHPSWNQPATLQCLSRRVVTVSGADLPASLSVDTVRATMNAVRRSVVGPAVTDSCITYPNGTFCYDTQMLDGYVDFALYLSGRTLYVLVPDNGVYDYGYALTRQ